MFVELNQYLFYQLLGSSVFLSSGWTGISTVSSGTMACDWSSSCPNPLVVVEDSNFLGVTVAWCLLLCAVTFMSTF